MSPRRRGRGHGQRGAAVEAPAEAAGSPIAPGGQGGRVVDTTAVRPSQGGPSHADKGSSGAGGFASTGGQAAGPRNDTQGPVRPPRPRPAPAAPVLADGEDASGTKASCTLAQMRRFIKSRPYVPVHELRRRFLIEGIEDEVSPMPTGQGTLYVGLPEREAGFLGELVKGGEVGCELLLDPTSPGVVGVFPMRPVARQ